MKKPREIIQMIGFRLHISSKDDREYIISVKDDKSIWIADGTGEGGEFDNEKFFEAIDHFYKTNF